MKQFPLQVEQPSFIPGSQRSALPRFHRRGAPGAVTQAVYFANMALLDRRALPHGRGVRRPWLETGLFPATGCKFPLS